MGALALGGPGAAFVDEPAVFVAVEDAVDIEQRGERREAEMLRFLATHPETAQDLVLEVLNDPAVSYEEFAAAAGAAFRGSARPNYAQLLARVRRILSEENGDG